MKFSTDTQQTSFTSPLGRMVLAATGECLVGAWFNGQSHQPDTSRWPAACALPLFQRVETQLNDYFAGSRKSFDLPLDLSCGTDFQQTIWRALLQIPYAATVSYGALSAMIGKPTAVRAVASAVGRNPFSIIVPCHRVLGTSGALTGYAGGIERKSALLQLEGAPFTREHNPGPTLSTL